jgi:ATP-dependent DNA helicase RecG
LPEKLPELQKIVINNMLKNSRITYAQLAGITGKSREAIRKNINKLKEAGLIKRIGPDKGGYWQVFTDYLKSDDE